MMTVSVNLKAVSYTHLDVYKRQPYLSKIIKDTTDKNFVTLVRDLKMRDAVRYLEKTKLSMEEISIRIGYNSEDHFYRVFSAFYGISPLQYRKKKQT